MKKIDITSIMQENGAGFHYESREPAPFENLNFNGPLEISLDLTNTGAGVFVEGTVTGTLEENCVGCLTAFQSKINAEISEEFVPLSQALPEVEDHMALEELSVFTLEGQERLDPTEAIRQSILLEVPSEPHCKPDCKGLCPRCGANLNAGECGRQRESKETPDNPFTLFKKGVAGRRNPNA